MRKPNKIQREILLGVAIAFLGTMGYVGCSPSGFLEEWNAQKQQDAQFNIWLGMEPKALKEMGISSKEAHLWYDAGCPSGRDMLKFKRAGIGLEMASDWYGLGILESDSILNYGAPRIKAREFDRWGRIGIQDTNVIFSWKRVGFDSVDEAISWKEKHFSPEEAISLKKKGVSPDEARKKIDQAIAEDAARNERQRERQAVDRGEPSNNVDMLTPEGWLAFRKKYPMGIENFTSLILENPYNIKGRCFYPFNAEQFQFLSAKTGLYKLDKYIFYIDFGYLIAPRFAYYLLVEGLGAYRYNSALGTLETVPWVRVINVTTFNIGEAEEKKTKKR